MSKCVRCGLEWPWLETYIPEHVCDATIGSHCTCQPAQAMKCEFCLSQESQQRAEKPKLSVEQIHAELKRLSSQGWDMKDRERIRDLIDQLPEPPQPDVLRECMLAFHSETEAKSENFVDAMNKRPNVEPMLEKAVTAALRRYLELRGLPADPELEGR